MDSHCNLPVSAMYVIVTVGYFSVNMYWTSNKAPVSLMFCEKAVRTFISETVAIATANAVCSRGVLRLAH